MNQNRKAAPLRIEQPQAFDMLRRLKGKKFIFKGRQIEILEICESGSDAFAIITDGKEIALKLDSVNQFIAEAYPLEQIAPQAAMTIQTQAVEPANRQEGMIDEMTDILYDVFKNIKAHPTRENIEQASTLSNTANTIANMMKLKLQAAKLQRK